MTDHNYPMLAKVAKSYMPGIEVYGGVHARLRETATAYLEQR